MASIVGNPWPENILQTRLFQEVVRDNPHLLSINKWFFHPQAPELVNWVQVPLFKPQTIHECLVINFPVLQCDAHGPLVSLNESNNGFPEVFGDVFSVICYFLPLFLAFFPLVGSAERRIWCAVLGLWFNFGLAPMPGRHSLLVDRKKFMQLNIFF